MVGAFLHFTALYSRANNFVMFIQAIKEMTIMLNAAEKQCADQTAMLKEGWKQGRRKWAQRYFGR